MGFTFHNPYVILVLTVQRFSGHSSTANAKATRVRIYVLLCWSHRYI
jgi:hypothetical protein